MMTGWKSTLSSRALAVFLILATTPWIGRGQVTTLEDELEGTAPPLIAPPAPAEAPSAPEPPVPPDPTADQEPPTLPPMEARTDMNLQLIPPPPPEEPFVPTDGYEPNLATEIEDEVLFGPQPEEQPVAELPKQDDSGFFITDWLGSLLSLGSSGDPDSRDRFRLSLNLNAGYDSNVLSSPVDPIGSAFSSLTGGVAYFLRSQRFELSVRGSGGVTVYQERPGGRTDYNGQLAIAGFYRFTRRISLNTELDVAYLSQPNPEVVGGISSSQGDYIVANTSLDVAYMLTPTILLRPGFRINAIKYQDEVVNEQSGFNSQTYSFSVEWLARPTTTLTGEYRYNPVTYNLDGEGSEGHILTAGFIQAFSKKLNWTLQAGAEQRLIQNPFESSDTTYLGPFVESELKYKFAPASELSGQLRFGTEPSGQGGVTIRQTLRTSLGIVHSFSGRLSLQFSLGYENSFYDQPGVIQDYSQEYFFGNAIARYRISNSLSLNLGYSHTAVFTDVGSGDYTRGVTTMGIEVSF